jgi:hypothetical protein
MAKQSLTLSEAHPNPRTDWVDITKILDPKADIGECPPFLRNLVSDGRHEVSGMLLIHLVSARFQFPNIVLAPSRVLSVVMSDRSMTIKTNRHCIV